MPTPGIFTVDRLKAECLYNEKNNCIVVGDESVLECGLRGQMAILNH